MNLYEVRCIAKTSNRSKDVYVIAENESKASEMALDKMKKLEWLYNDYVERVTLLASENHYKCQSVLVIDAKK